VRVERQAVRRYGSRKNAPPRPDVEDVYRVAGALLLLQVANVWPRFTGEPSGLEQHVLVRLNVPMFDVECRTRHEDGSIAGHLDQSMSMRGAFARLCLRGIDGSIWLET
jgi:hypothetical protein